MVQQQQLEVATSPNYDKKCRNSASCDCIVHCFVALNGQAKLDCVLPAASLFSIRPEIPVLLRMEPSGHGAAAPRTIISILKETALKLPNHVALCVKRDAKEWKPSWTYEKLWNDVIRVARSFIAAGLQRGNGVGIIGFNSPEWFIANYAAIACGGLSVGIYSTNTAETCEWQLFDSAANICVVENTKQLEKIMAVWTPERLPNLKVVVQWIGPLDEKVVKGHSGVYTWEQFLELGRQSPELAPIQCELDSRMAELAANKCCTLIYTSATTGTPKGVMLSHDNFTWTARQCIILAGNVQLGKERVVSYLPLSHVAAQLLDIYIPLLCGATVHCASPDALRVRGNLVATIREIQPTILLGVPRVYEKIQEGIQDASASAPGWKRKLVRWARRVGLRGNIARANGQPLPSGWNLAQSLVFKKVRNTLGLDNCRFLISGAAPIMRETVEFFLSLDLQIYDAYGMTECSAPHSINLPPHYRIGTSGMPIPGAKTHIVNPDPETGVGEICMDGRHVFMGYINNAEKTDETLDGKGWLHSGDAGKVDTDGYIHVTGRIKELLVTAGGENVPPVPIEEAMKTTLPVVSQAMLVGDQRRFLSMLITLKTEMDPDTLLPTDQLAPSVVSWAASLGCKCSTLSELLAKDEVAVLTAIKAAVDKVNSVAPSQAQRVQKWSILPRDFSIAGGELGPTMKIRRGIVLKLYKETIDNIYANTEKAD